MQKCSVLLELLVIYIAHLLKQFSFLINTYDVVCASDLTLLIFLLCIHGLDRWSIKSKLCPNKEWWECIIIYYKDVWDITKARGHMPHRTPVCHALCYLRLLEDPVISQSTWLCHARWFIYPDSDWL